MNKVVLNHVLRGLLPTPFFFFLAILLPKLLARYSTIGPVSNGQPMIPHWPDVIVMSLFFLMAVGCAYSLREAWKLTGSSRYVMIGVVLLMLPVQFALIVGTQVGIFGK